MPRKNIEARVLRLLGAGPDADNQVRAAQHFISQGAWDDTAILVAHQRLVDQPLGEADGVLILDGSDVAKQGTHSVGVARQWCGATGKRDKCQAGVYLGYASRLGYTLLDRRLYLPEVWFTEAYRARWQACRIPDETTFQTKPALAAALVAEVMGERADAQPERGGAAPVPAVRLAPALDLAGQLPAVAVRVSLAAVRLLLGALLPRTAPIANAGCWPSRRLARDPLVVILSAPADQAARGPPARIGGCRP